MIKIWFIRRIVALPHCIATWRL